MTYLTLEKTQKPNDPALVTTLALPQETGKYLLYTITPTTGPAANRPIYILLKNIVPKGPLAGKTVIKVYRQFQGDNPFQWTEAGTISSRAKTLGPAENVIFKSDGTATWTDPQSKAVYIFALGKLKLEPDTQEKA